MCCPLSGRHLPGCNSCAAGAIYNKTCPEQNAREMRIFSLSVMYKTHRSKQENGKTECHVEQSDAIDL